MIDKKLSHLNNVQINELVKRYYEGEAVSKLLEDYNIEASANELCKLFLWIEIKNNKCPYCYVNIV